MGCVPSKDGKYNDRRVSPTKLKESFHREEKKEPIINEQKEKEVEKEAKEPPRNKKSSAKLYNNFRDTGASSPSNTSGGKKFTTPIKPKPPNSFSREDSAKRKPSLVTPKKGIFYPMIMKICFFLDEVLVSKKDMIFQIEDFKKKYKKDGTIGKGMIKFL